MGLRATFRRAGRAVRVVTRPEPVLWSHSTASEIVDAIAGDAAAGTLTPVEATELIARVWHRTAAENGERG